MNTDSIYPELLRVITKRLDIVADRDFYHRDPAGHLAALREAAIEMDALVEKLPPETPPMLRHYLERQSLLKAAEFLRENACAS